MKAQDLKNSVLQLAVQGKLVEQNLNDEPASVLLEKIRDEKEKLIKEKKIKRAKKLPEINEEEKPFEIPDNWEWVRLEDIIYSIGSKQNQIKQSQILDNGDYPVVSQSINIIEGYSNETEKLLGIPNSVIVFGDHSRTIKFIDFDFIIGADGTKILVPIKVYAKYLYYILKYNVINIKDRGYSRHYQFLKEKLVPLAPLEEQKRIVAKIEEVLEKIKEYDKAQKELTQLEKTFPQDMKKSILQYAIQGKLVEQNSNDEPASILLEKIKVEKEQLIKEKKIKREKPLPEISEEEKPFEIPDSWEWVRLSQICKYIKAGGDKPKDFSIVKSMEYKIPVIANGKTNAGIIGYTKIPTEENICITISGRGTIGYPCIRREPFCPIVRLIVVNPSSETSIEYLHYVLQYFIEEGVGTSIKQLTVPMIMPKVIPLPPLEEQKRIVDKIETLMCYIDKLEDSINNEDYINGIVQAKSIELEKDLINN